MARRNARAVQGGRTTPRRTWSEKDYGRGVKMVEHQRAAELDLSKLAKEIGVRFK